MPAQIRTRLDQISAVSNEIPSTDCLRQNRRMRQPVVVTPRMPMAGLRFGAHYAVLDWFENAGELRAIIETPEREIMSVAAADMLLVD
jgi:hypothetical protein